MANVDATKIHQGPGKLWLDVSVPASGNRLVIDRKLTHDQIATVVGATRQWVTMSLDKFQKKGIISVGRQSIVIERYDLLMAQLDNE